MDAWSLMRGDAFIHFVCGSRRLNIRLGVLLLIPKSPHMQKNLLRNNYTKMLIKTYNTQFSGHRISSGGWSTVKINQLSQCQFTNIFWSAIFGKTQDCASAPPCILTRPSSLRIFLHFLIENSSKQQDFEIWRTLNEIQKRSFQGALTNEKLMRIIMLDANETILKKNISFIVHFFFSKYSFSLDTFWTHLMPLVLTINIYWITVK